LIKLIRKDVSFVWNEVCKIAFELLKQTIIKTLILAHFDFIKQIYIESDSSNFVNVEILSQMRKNDELHSITFFSKNLVSTKCNYEIYDKELLIIIKCFEQWRLKLMSTKLDVSMKVLTDHKNLEYFMFIKQFNQRQSRWAQFFIDFNFVIIYLSEKFNEKADALTKRTKNISNKEDDRQKQQFQTLLSFDQFDKSLIAIALTLIHETDRLQLMQKMHDQFAFDHLEINKTIKLLKKITHDHEWHEM
jgi:hypothetical protein